MAMFSGSSFGNAGDSLFRLQLKHALMSRINGFGRQTQQPARQAGVGQPAARQQPARQAGTERMGYTVQPTETITATLPSAAEQAAEWDLKQKKRDYRNSQRGFGANKPSPYGR